MAQKRDNRPQQDPRFGGKTAISPWQVARRAVCPRCGAGPLFKGYLTVRADCPQCGLDYSGVDSGDGPAVFVIFIVGFVVAFAALAVEMAFQPPVWLHLLLWIPMIVAGTFALLRPLKALMIALQYRHGAGEGRLHGPDEER